MYKLPFSLGVISMWLISKSIFLRRLVDIKLSQVSVYFEPQDILFLKTENVSVIKNNICLMFQRPIMLNMKS